MDQFEKLLENRNLFIYDILLKQDINNCTIWLKKINFYKKKEKNNKNLNDLLNIYVEAITKIDPKLAHKNENYDDDNENNDSNTNNDDLDNENTNDDLNNFEKIEEIENAKFKQTTGLEQIWIDYSKVYQSNKDYFTARSIFSTATKVPFMNSNDLVEIYLAWADMELTIDASTEEEVDKCFENAINIIKSSLVKPTFKNIGKVEDQIRFFDDKIPAAYKIHKSVKLWSFYLDLIESSNDFQETCKVYEEIMNLKILTPVILINYINFLWDNQNFEKSFKIFEIGLDKFNYFPIKFEIYNIYLGKILLRFKQMKQKKMENFISIERIRDLFEQAINECSGDLVKPIYLLYADFEQQNGLSSRSLKIYGEGIKQLHEWLDSQISINNSLEIKEKIYKDIFNFYEILIQKTIEFKNFNEARIIYENIISHEDLPNNYIIKFVLSFKNFEVKLGEVVRGRELLKYGCELLLKPSPLQENGKIYEKYWKEWREFELNYGDENTFKEMIKMKRAIGVKLGLSNNSLVDYQNFFENPLNEDEDDSGDEGREEENASSD
ncbi:mRNA splicing protein SYF1 ASCRUDRAFT_77363 [Ascoidea rubescens DSM 1968]|uniref:Pre-mRNA-splicing factor SYF1 n=1 Tax=Ascoidea rubescens DSM 1968 TaxID=1344418 RepID=A0A1D2VCL8_9ASCO|nr:hypothetical protein ASCRUDRAFT_77363 [Ascoidea rubescens DSM 1968]ODV59302.1 hypothetical protein ASCRUDRAFT_77363 [Ascoidea rubescens DSM 1968]